MSESRGRLVEARVSVGELTRASLSRVSVAESASTATRSVLVALVAAAVLIAIASAVALLSSERALLEGSVVLVVAAAAAASVIAAEALEAVEFWVDVLLGGGIGQKWLKIDSQSPYLVRFVQNVY